jgi:hypothetical protein
MPNEDEPIIRQHLAKFDKLFPAMALVFHLVDCAAHGVCGPVTKDAALRAAAWCEYLEAHARRCYGLLKDDGLRAAQALAVKLERGALEDGFTLRDVRRNQWRSLTTDEAMEVALDWLEDDAKRRRRASKPHRKAKRHIGAYFIDRLSVRQGMTKSYVEGQVVANLPYRADEPGCRVRLAVLLVVKDFRDGAHRPR